MRLPRRAKRVTCAEGDCAFADIQADEIECTWATLRRRRRGSPQFPPPMKTCFNATMVAKGKVTCSGSAACMHVHVKNATEVVCKGSACGASNIAAETISCQGGANNLY